ncbi:MAG: Fic family protein [Chromatiaceae bacterium]|nr:Fic family protein [Chromatiaceae bacterium]
MRIPITPPRLQDLLGEIHTPERMAALLSRLPDIGTPHDYLHWDKLQHYSPPEGLSVREWWLLLKLSRSAALRPIGLTDQQGRPFRFAVPERVAAELHRIDLGMGDALDVPEPIMNPQTRDRYRVASLMEESITSSQLEGAVTTREVARDMIRSGRKPRDNSERMILNNFNTMQRIRELKDEPLTPERVFEIHRRVTEDTLEEGSAAGRLRRPDERRVVADDYGTLYHEPPAAEELPGRLAALCDFANGLTPDGFVHPAVRAILLHFWLAYDHPFVDGNGRTARALFYWAMLHRGYWLFEFVSISAILRKAPAQYSRSFLYTETDDNDLTYFLLAQMEVIRKAMRELQDYIARKTSEVREVEQHLRALELFNHRQVALIRHATKHPGHRYTFISHQKSHAVAYQTARTDLLDLATRGILEPRKTGRQAIFVSPPDVLDRLLSLEKSEPNGSSGCCCA